MAAPPSNDDAGLVIEQAHPSLQVDEAALRGLIRRVVEREEAQLRELTVVLTDHDTVLSLNRQYLDHDYLTDVLSFPLGDEENVVEGEIYVDLDTAHERHDEFEATFEEEAFRYVIHGLLHLLGYRDATADQRQHVRRLEDRYLALL